MTSIRFLIYCDEIHVKSTLKSGLCGRRSDKVCLLQSFGTIRLLPKFRTFDEMSHRETEGMEVLFNPLLVENCKLFSYGSKPTHALLAS